MNTLVRVRQVESALLIVLAAALIWVRFGHVAILLDFPLLAIAVLLASRNLTKDASSKDSQLDRFEELISQGSQVYSLYKPATDGPRLRQRTPELFLAKYEMDKWLDRVRFELRLYPEFAGIFEAHGASNHEDEVEGRMRRLRQIKNLAAASYRVGLHR
jgi:hypothetical protein